MIRKSFILLFAVSSLFYNSSCVSKKKYIEMSNAKFQADQKIADLNTVVSGKNQRIETMIADFTQMKNELMESNAIKNQYIDSLSGELNKLAKTVNLKESVIGEKQSSFEFEKRQLLEDVANQKKLAGQKQQEIIQLSDENKELNDAKTQLTFDLNREKSERLALQNNLNARESNIGELNGELSKLKNEVANLKKQNAEKNETINRLENNVKLLKKEIK